LAGHERDGRPRAVRLQSASLRANRPGRRGPRPLTGLAGLDGVAGAPGWVRSGTWPGSLPHGKALEGTDLNRAAPEEDRTALGEFGGGVDGVGLHDREAADDLLGLHERAVRDDLLGVDDASVRLQPVAGVEQPALLESLGDPGVPLLEDVLHLLGRHRGPGVLAAAVDKQELGHVRVPLAWAAS